MVTATDLRDYVMSLSGVIEAPHFDRVAFKVNRIFVTLASDAQTANLMLTTDEQAYQCQAAPDVFLPLDNAWGRKGATLMMLHNADKTHLVSAVNLAYAHAVGKVRR